MKKRIILLLMALFFLSAQYVFAADAAKTNDEPVYSVLENLFNWKISWETKALDKYISFYDSDTRFSGLNIGQLKEKKRNIFKAADKISLFLSDLCLEKKEDMIVTSFVQYYRIKGSSDTGRKTLTWAKKGKQWKIISEEYEGLKIKDDKKLSSLGLMMFIKDKREDLLLKMSEANAKKMKVSQAIGRTLKLIMDFPQGYSFSSQEPSIIHLKSSLVQGAIIYGYNNCSSKRGIVFLSPYKEYNVAPSYDRNASIFFLQIEAAPLKSPK